MFQAMSEVMQANPARNKFLIDGFPRNKDNLDGWEREMGDKVNLKFVLFFDCADDVSMCHCTLYHLLNFF
jgi:UMP-CMP kinase